MVLDLPEVVWQHVALHLPAPDILNFLSAHRRIHTGLGDSEAFWNLLIDRDATACAPCGDCPTSARRAYMVQAYKDHLPTVKWYPIQTRRTIAFSSAISAREGHIACVFKGPTESRVCIMGGFTDDHTVYMLKVPKSLTGSQRQQNSSAAAWTWDRLHPVGPRTSFVYGSTLTPLEMDESSPNLMRAIRFGGFKAGGYSQETNEVAVLTVKEESTEDGKNHVASWETLSPQNSQFADPRAYHTATLIGGRYLLVIGGMTWRESILKEALLDTHTWTWCDLSISTASEEKPSGRHGHSVVLDSKRNRLVLFGGGSGTDLLRSGRDNSEVWELKLGDGWETNIHSSLPWTWRKIHSDSTPNSGDEGWAAAEEGAAEDAPADTDETQQHVSPRDALCMGRCHNCIRVSPDRALLLFGSGRPSTNGVVSYDLKNDKFFRPKVTGPMPVPRFTGVVTFLPDEGYLFAHGGYSSQESDAIGDMTVLDLAPALNREFTGLPIDRNFRCNGEVSDEDAIGGRQNADAMLQRMLFSLSNVDAEERQAMASQMLGHLISSGQMGGRSFMLMNMIANGAAILSRGDDMEDDDDEDYEDEDFDGEED